MTTPRIEEIKAEFQMFVPDDDGSAMDWLENTLTQLVKEVEAGERERFMRLIQEYSHTTEPEWIAKDLMEALSSNEDL